MLQYLSNVVGFFAFLQAQKFTVSSNFESSVCVSSDIYVSHGDRVASLGWPKMCDSSPGSLLLHKDGNCPLTHQCLSSTGQSILLSASFFGSYSGYSLKLTLPPQHSRSDHKTKTIG